MHSLQRFVHVIPIALAGFYLANPSVSAGSEGNAEEETFRLKLYPPSSTFANGPVGIRVDVLYEGTREVILPALALEAFDVSFDAPTDWVPRRARGALLVSGARAPRTVSPGETISRTVYLHDYFENPQPGTVTLHITVQVSLQEGENTRVVRLTAPMEVDLRQEDPAAFKARIERISRQIQAEREENKRTELLRSLEALSHPELVGVFLRVLSNPTLRDYHIRARERVVDLCDTYHAWGDLVDFLAVLGSRGDCGFFSFWEKRGDILSPAQIDTLRKAASLWIRLYTVETFGDPGGGLTDSLRTELEALKSRVDELPRPRAPASKPAA